MENLNPPTRRLRTCLSALALGWLLAAPARAGLSYEEGLAQRPDGRGLLYREQHWVRREGAGIVERLVLYRCGDGTAFARKTLDYRRSPVAPAFRFEDRRFGYVEGLRWREAPEAYVRAAAGAPEKIARLAIDRLVADAGFDEFIRRHWTQLLSGREVPLAFLVPARLQSIAFGLRRLGPAQASGEAAWVFRLSLRGWLRLLAPHVDVHYGQQSRRLLRFEGPSNLLDDAGRAPLDTRIDFPRPARPAEETQWRAALDQPLSACRTEP
jgi:hypothetical protein